MHSERRPTAMATDMSLIAGEVPQTLSSLPDSSESHGLGRRIMAIADELPDKGLHRLLEYQSMEFKRGDYF